MAGQGTGRPLFFRCSWCRRKAAPYWDSLRRKNVNPYRDDGWLVSLTGRMRDRNTGNAQGRSDTHEREYECLTCGHIGWSNHTDLKRQAEALAK